MRDEEREGLVLSSDGVTLRASGLSGAMAGELLSLEGGGTAVVLSLERSAVVAGVISRGASGATPAAGAGVSLTGAFPSLPVGTALLGRIVDPLGAPLDDAGPVAPPSQLSLSSPPGLPDAERRPLARRRRRGFSDWSVGAIPTGIKWVDCIDPLTRGACRPIVGGPRSGKTTLGIDLVVGHAAGGGRSVLVWLGGSSAELRAIVATLARCGALGLTAIVAAPMDAPPAAWLLAPLAGCAIAESLAEPGGDVLVVIDDIGKQADALSVMGAAMGQWPALEGSPAGLPQAQADLVDRAGRVGAGVVTIAPVIRAVPGLHDPTVIGLLQSASVPYWLDLDLFRRGVRPAFVSPRTVSKIVTNVPRALRRLAGSARLELAQHAELEAFARLCSEPLDAATHRRLEQGRMLRALLCQRPASPVSQRMLCALLFAARQGLFDGASDERAGGLAEGAALSRVPAREQQLRAFLLGKGAELGALRLDDHAPEAALRALLEGFAS